MRKRILITFETNDNIDESKHVDYRLMNLLSSALRSPKYAHLLNGWSLDDKFPNDYTDQQIKNEPFQF